MSKSAATVVMALVGFHLLGLALIRLSICMDKIGSRRNSAIGEALVLYSGIVMLVGCFALAAGLATAGVAVMLLCEAYL